MLKNIDPLLNADVLYALRAMGHGDTLVICDTNFPADSVARETVLGDLLRIDGVTAARAVEAVLSVVPLDTFVDDSARRGGPMMVLAAPTLPAPGLSHACDVYGASVLVLPDASRDAVQVRASLCTQGEINKALLYATVSMVGTHAALWTTHD